jgi:hypothetical protein
LPPTLQLSSSSCNRISASSSSSSSSFNGNLFSLALLLLLSLLLLRRLPIHPKNASTLSSCTPDRPSAFFSSFSLFSGMDFVFVLAFFSRASPPQKEPGCVGGLAPHSPQLAFFMQPHFGLRSFPFTYRSFRKSRSLPPQLKLSNESPLRGSKFETSLLSSVCSPCFSLVRGDNPGSASGEEATPVSAAHERTGFCHSRKNLAPRNWPAPLPSDARSRRQPRFAHVHVPGEPGLSPRSEISPPRGQMSVKNRGSSSPRRTSPRKTQKKYTPDEPGFFFHLGASRPKELAWLEPPGEPRFGPPRAGKRKKSPAVRTGVPRRA